MVVSILNVAVSVLNSDWTELANFAARMYRFVFCSDQLVVYTFTYTYLLVCISTSENTGGGGGKIAKIGTSNFVT